MAFGLLLFVVSGITFGLFWKTRIAIDDQKPLVIIHCFGKVASISLEQTFKRDFPSLEVYRTHILQPNDKKIQYQLQYYKSEGNQNSYESTKTQLKVAEKILRKIDEAKKSKRKVYFVTGIREPVSLYLSAYFQEFYDTSQSVDHVMSALSLGLKEYSDVQNWWATEFFDYHKLSFEEFERKVYKKGNLWVLEKEDNIEIIMYRFEDLVFDEIMRTFNSQWQGVVAQENRAENKPYKEDYSYVKENIKFNPEHLEVLLSLPIVNFFYSKSEIQEIKNRFSLLD